MVSDRRLSKRFVFGIFKGEISWGGGGNLTTWRATYGFLVFWSLESQGVRGTANVAIF